MLDIDERLYTSINGKARPLSKKAVYAMALEQGDDFVNALFRVLNSKLDEYTGKVSLTPLYSIYEYLDIVITNAPQLNRKKIQRKIAKLEEKILQLLTENKSKLIDTKVACKELRKMNEKLSSLQLKVVSKETNQLNFLEYLIDEVKNIEYLEKTFEKMPSIVNVEDKDGTSIFTKIIYTYVGKLDTPRENKEDLLYYVSVISLILNQQSLNLKPLEHQNIMNYLNNYLDEMMKKKNRDNDSKERCQWIEKIKETIQQENSKRNNMEKSDMKNQSSFLYNKQIIEKLGVRYQIPISFNEQLIKELRLHQTAVSLQNYPDRVIASDYIITIDDIGAAQLDDGLSCKRLKNGNYLLGVHSASVLGYFPYQSPLVTEALNRGNSIYLPERFKTKDDKTHRFIPMFPTEFSTEKASLLEGEKRLARSYYFEIDQEGEVINQKFLKTIVTSKKKTTYQEIDTIITQGTEDYQLGQTVQYLAEVTECLEKKYKPSELYMNIKNGVNVQNNLNRKKNLSEKIVYYSMLLTGKKVAEYFAEQGYPCLYRVHEIDNQTNEKLEQMVQSLGNTYGGQKFEKLYHLLSGIYPKGHYDISGGHQGLGLEHYCNCTSELRKGADIVVEHALEVCHDNKNPKDKELARLEEEIKARALELNQKANPIDWFTQDCGRCMKKTKIIKS